MKPRNTSRVLQPHEAAPQGRGQTSPGGSKSIEQLQRADRAVSGSDEVIRSSKASTPPRKRPRARNY